MYSKFLGLEKEKQDRIINAAITEFAKMGYDNASTNEIVKAAEISKGILFHYFKNKKQLYLFLYDYLIKLVLKEFYDKLNYADRDIINRLRASMNIKIELMKIYPEAFNFFDVAYVEGSEKVREELEKRNSEYISEAFGKIFENMDTSLFKEEINPKMAINIIIWSLTGFSNELIKKAGNDLTALDYNEGFRVANVYIDMLKQCFYK